MVLNLHFLPLHIPLFLTFSSPFISIMTYCPSSPAIFSDHTSFPSFYSSPLILKFFPHPLLHSLDTLSFLTVSFTINSLCANSGPVTPMLRPTLTAHLSSSFVPLRCSSDTKNLMCWNKAHCFIIQAIQDFIIKNSWFLMPLVTCHLVKNQEFIVCSFVLFPHRYKSSEYCHFSVFHIGMEHFNPSVLNLPLNSIVFA